MGGLVTLLMNGPLAIGAYWASRHGLQQPPGVARGLGAAVLAWAWATIGMELLGSIGLFAPGPLMAWSGLGLAVGWMTRRFDRGSRSTASPIAGPTAWGIGATLAVGLSLWAMGPIWGRSLMLPVKVVSDGPIYHLYFAARWWKAGRLVMVASPFGEVAAPYFPANGDLLFAWLMTGWGGDRLARVGQSPFLLMAGVACFAMARRLGTGINAAVIAAAWFATTSALMFYAFEPNVDTIFTAGYLASAYFFLRYALGDDGCSALALGGLAAGGAWGTKTTGLVFIPPLLMLAGLAALVRPGSAGAKVRRLGLLAATAASMAGFWYVRNTAMTGNPLYPLEFRALGRVILPGWYGAEVMTRNGMFYLPFRDWRSFIDIVLGQLDPRLAPIWIAAGLGAWWWGRKAPLRWSGWVWGASALAAANVALYWVAIPYRTQPRFMFQALGLAAIPLALTFERGRALRVGGLILLAVHLLTAQGWPYGPGDAALPWDLSTIVPNTADPPIAPPLHGQSNPIPGLAGFAALVVAGAWARRASRPSAGRATFAAVVTLAAGVVWALPFSRFLMPTVSGPARAFPIFPDYFDAWIELESRSGPGGVRVAYSGTNIPYYLMASDLRNDVRYINVDGQAGWLLHDYHRVAIDRGVPNWPDVRPPWDRLRLDYQAWLAELHRENIQILAVARITLNDGPHLAHDADHFPIERTWAESHPESFVPLHGVSPPDRHLRLYRVAPPVGGSILRNPDGSRRETPLISWAPGDSPL